jgi:hypothetical protein
MEIATRWVVPNSRLIQSGHGHEHIVGKDLPEFSANKEYRATIAVNPEVRLLYG